MHNQLCLCNVTFYSETRYSLRKCREGLDFINQELIALWKVGGTYQNGAWSSFQSFVEDASQYVLYFVKYIIVCCYCHNVYCTVNSVTLSSCFASSTIVASKCIICLAVDLTFSVSAWTRQHQLKRKVISEPELVIAFWWKIQNNLFIFFHIINLDWHALINHLQ